MKRFATGLLTALCATAFSIAQPINQPADQPLEQTNYQPVAPTPIETSTVAEPQTAPTEPQMAPAPAQAVAPAQPTVSQQATAPQAQTNEASALDKPLVPIKKKNPVSVGVKAAFIYGKFWGFKEMSDGYEEPTGFGGEFGAAARFGMAEGLQFSPELSFRIFNLSHEDDGVERCYDQMFLDLAFYIRGVLGGGFFLEVGPQISINTSSEYEIDGSTNDFENIEQATAEFGLNVGAGYYITNNFSVGFRWYMGFNEVFPDVKYYDDLTKNDYDGAKVKKSVKWSTVNLKGAQTMMFKLGFTYWFI